MTKKYLAVGVYRTEDGESDVQYFITDGTRKPLEEELIDTFLDEFGVPLNKEDIIGAYHLSDVYDYTDKKTYKVKVSLK